MAIKKGFSQYALGNDYDPTPVSAHWDTDSYLDGIFQTAKDDYATTGWNKLFKTVLPQETWQGIDEATSAFSAIYSPDYATASAVDAVNWKPEEYIK